MRGFTLNERRLAQRGLTEERETLDLLARSLRNQALMDNAGHAGLDLIAGYADTWRLLLEYDENRLLTPTGVQPSAGVLDHYRGGRAIAQLTHDLMARNEASSLFGNLRDDALDAILANIEQTMCGEALYRSREDKAPRPLHFIVKDHPFPDGNKRIGPLLFLLCLKQERMEHRLNPQALAAPTLLIAESEPAGMELIIRLPVNLLVGFSD